MIDSLLRLDAALRDWIAGLPHPAWLDRLMATASAAGRGAVIWFALAVVVGCARRSQVAAAFRAALAILVTMLVVDYALKPWFARDRPFVVATNVRVIDVRSPTYSFPSGHTANSVAGAFGLSRAWPAAAPAFWILAVLVSISRVFVGVHYPMDLVGGALVGLACAYFVTGGRAPRTPAPRPRPLAPDP